MEQVEETQQNSQTNLSEEEFILSIDELKTSINPGVWSGVLHIWIQENESTNQSNKGQSLVISPNGELEIKQLNEEYDQNVFSILSSKETINDIFHLKFDPLTALMSELITTNDFECLLKFSCSFNFPHKMFQSSFQKYVNEFTNQNVPNRFAKFDYPLNPKQKKPWHKYHLREIHTENKTDHDQSILNQLIRYLPFSFQGAEWDRQIILIVTSADTADHVDVDNVQKKLTITIIVENNNVTVFTNPANVTSNLPILCTLEAPKSTVISILKGELPLNVAFVTGNIKISDQKSINDFTSAFKLSQKHYKEFLSIETIIDSKFLKNPYEDESDSSIVDSIQFLSKSFTPVDWGAVAQITFKDSNYVSNIWIYIETTKITFSNDPDFKSTLDYLFHLQCSKHQFCALVLKQTEISDLAVQGCLPVFHISAVEKFFSAFQKRDTLLSQYLMEHFGVRVTPDLEPSVEIRPLVLRVKEAFDYIPKCITNTQQSPYPSTSCVRYLIKFGQNVKRAKAGDITDNDIPEIEQSQVNNLEDDVENNEHRNEFDMYRRVTISDAADGSAVITVDEGWETNATILCTVETDAMTFVDLTIGYLSHGLAFKYGNIIVDDTDHFIQFCQMLNFTTTKYEQYLKERTSTSTLVSNTSFNQISARVNPVQPLSSITLPAQLKKGYVVDLSLPSQRPPSPVAEELQQQQEEKKERISESEHSSKETEKDESMIDQIISRARARLFQSIDWREQSKQVLRDLSEHEMATEKEGFLAIKKSNAWKMRYMIVKGKKLFCYGKGFLENQIEFHWQLTLHSSFSVSDVIELSDQEREAMPAALKSFIYTFSISEPTKTRTFATPNFNLAKEWVSVLQKSLSLTNFKHPGIISNAPTIKELIEILTPSTGNSVNLKLVKSFLLTYQSFSDNKTVFLLFKKRFYDNVPQEGDSQIITEQKNKIRESVLEIMEIWIFDHIEDFHAQVIHDIGNTLEEELNNWINELKSKGFEEENNKLKTTFEYAKKPTIKIVLPKPAQSIPFPRYSMKTWGKITFIDLDPEEIARQLTLMEQKIFLSINPREFLGQKWAKPDAEINAPQIMKCIENFNRTMHKFATAIVEPASAIKRAVVIKLVIQVCEYLRLVKNFNSLKALLAALSLPAVSRLEATWSQVDQNSQATLENLQQDVSGSQGHARYRKILLATTPPALPFLGVLLTDLAFIEDGNKTFEDEETGQEKINFSKQELFFDLIEDFVHYTGASFSLREVPEICEVIEAMPRLKDDDLSKLSIAREK